MHRERGKLLYPYCFTFKLEGQDTPVEVTRVYVIIPLIRQKPL